MAENVLGGKLRAARKQAGLKAKEAAVLVRREPQTVYRWEWGTTKPTLDELVVLAKAYGTTVGELVDEPPGDASEA